MENLWILYFGTSNFDAMRNCFEDFGFEVTENRYDQLMRMFGSGRAVRVRRGDLDFTLEESTNKDHKAYFNLLLDGSDEDLIRLKSLGYACDTQTSLYGTFHSFQTPDGGTIVLM